MKKLTVTIVRHCDDCGTMQSFKTVIRGRHHEMCCRKCGWILATADTVVTMPIPFVGGPPVTTATWINMTPRQGARGKKKGGK